MWPLRLWSTISFSWTTISYAVIYAASYETAFVSGPLSIRRCLTSRNIPFGASAIGIMPHQEHSASFRLHQFKLKPYEEVDSTSSIAHSQRRTFVTDTATRIIRAAGSVTVLTIPTQATSVSAQQDNNNKEIAWTPFNGLIFNYRNSNYGGLDAADITSGEPTIPYKDFLVKLSSGQVDHVDFFAPHGDVSSTHCLDLFLLLMIDLLLKKDNTPWFLCRLLQEAYAWLKPEKGGEKVSGSIRIGEGYPLEQHDGWSSPTFVMRALKEKDVPYKFIVPGLAAYK